MAQSSTRIGPQTTVKSGFATTAPPRAVDGRRYRPVAAWNEAQCWKLPGHLKAGTCMALCLTKLKSVASDPRVLLRGCVSAVSAATLLACTTLSAATPAVDLDRLAALDKEAATRVSSLSDVRRATWHMVPGESAAGDHYVTEYMSRVATLIEGGKQLLALEHQINRMLERAYVGASTTLTITIDDRVTLVRIASLHWHTQLRRHLQRGLHTAVPGLKDDPRCAGDLLADQLLLEYLRAVWGDTNSSIQRVVDSLTRIAAQSACLGTEQSESFARAAAAAFSDVEAFLRIQQLEWVVPSLAALLAQPLVLFYDVEKYRGVDASLGRWFSKYQQVLVESVQQRRAPMKWHGLWLYDRSTGRLIGFVDQVRPKDENEIRLDRFLTSLTSPENLGAGDCSFKEMVQRGLGDSGYMCGGATCEIERQLQGAAFDLLSGSPSARASAGSRLEILSAAGGIGRLPGESTGQICVAPREGTPKGTSSLCAPTSGGGALSPIADTLACVSRQVIRPGTEVMSCVMEASGYCSSPVERLSKDLKSNDLNGVPLGKECGIGGDEAGSGDTSSTRPVSPATQDQLNKAKADQGDAQTGANLQGRRLEDAKTKDREAEAKLQQAKAQLEIARSELQKASQSSNPDPDAIAAARDKVSAAEEGVAGAQTNRNAAAAELAAAQAAKDRADQVLREANERVRQAEEKFKRESDGAAPPKLDPLRQAGLLILDFARSKSGSTSAAVETLKATRGRCDPDNPDCEMNKCGAMSESARKTMACVKRKAEESSLPEFMARGLKCDPRSCDPEETTATDGLRESACIKTMGPDDSQSRVTKQCGLVHCASSEVAFVTASGQCNCSAPATLGAGVEQSLSNHCAAARCESGAAEFKNGSCVCREATMPTVGGPSVPDALKIGSPPAFLNKNPIPPSAEVSDIKRP